MINRTYNSLLGHGLGLIDETSILLDLWHPGLSTTALYDTALKSGRFPSISARRLVNVVKDGFAPRYLVDHGAPATMLKKVQSKVPGHVFVQLMFLYTCRAHAILADFVRDVYWVTFSSGKDVLDNEDARTFVNRANEGGRTTVPWSATTIQRVSGYLTGCCADFGLLERGQKQVRKLVRYRIESDVAVILAYQLHFAGKGDNAVVNHEDWALFGLEPLDVVEELKRLSRHGHFIVQQAGSAVHLGWMWKSMDEVIDALTN